jgi:hypothetical protein
VKLTTYLYQVPSLECEYYYLHNRDLLRCAVVWACRPLPEFFRNFHNHLQDHMAPEPRRPQSTLSLPSEPQISFSSAVSVCLHGVVRSHRYNISFTVLPSTESAAVTDVFPRDWW